MKIDENTAIPPAGGQNIGRIAQRLCAALTPPDTAWTETHEEQARRFLYDVYLAGYLRGTTDESHGIATGERRAR